MEKAFMTEEEFSTSIDLLGRRLIANPVLRERMYGHGANTTKLINKAQEPTGIKAAILNASFIALLAIIAWTIGVAFPGNA